MPEDGLRSMLWLMLAIDLVKSGAVWVVATPANVSLIWVTRFEQDQCMGSGYLSILS